MIVVHESIRLPYLFAVYSELEHLQGKCSLAKFLHYHILITGVEEVVVLESVVVVEILSLVEVSYGLVVVIRVNDGSVACV